MSVSIASVNKDLVRKKSSGESLGKLCLGMTNGSIGLFAQDGSRVGGVRRLDFHTEVNDLIIVTVDLMISGSFFEDSE